MTQSTETELKYWICDASPSTYHSVANWYGVISEELGGIIAYFRSEEAAHDYVDFLERDFVESKDQ